METLEPVWNGELERRGEADFALSSYYGRSSLYHSANWERLEWGEAKETADGRVIRPRGPDRKPRIKPGSFDVPVQDLLKKGLSYGAIMRALGVSLDTVRSNARRLGINRSALAGQNQFTAGRR